MNENSVTDLLFQNIMCLVHLTSKMGVSEFYIFLTCLYGEGGCIHEVWETLHVQNITDTDLKLVLSLNKGIV